MDADLIDVSDGRVVEVTDTGSTERPVVVFHSGTPVGLVPFEPLIAAAAERHVRVVNVLRPGYGRSTANPGRSVADVVSDISAVAVALGIERYVAIGHSGGGPHALACRALDGARCRAAITVAGVAPFGFDGLDFLDGMGEDNVAEFTAALEGDPALTDYLSAAASTFVGVQGGDIIEAMESLLPEVDQAYLRDGFADFLAAAVRSGVTSGIDGWHDDDIAFTRQWGFELAGLSSVSIWQGSDDLMVPFAHAKYLVHQIMGSTPHLLEGEGHLSLLGGRMEAILDEALAYMS